MRWPAVASGPTIRAASRATCQRSCVPPERSDENAHAASERTPMRHTHRAAATIAPAHTAQHAQMHALPLTTHAFSDPTRGGRGLTTSIFVMRRGLPAMTRNICVVPRRPRGMMGNAFVVMRRPRGTTRAILVAPRERRGTMGSILVVPGRPRGATRMRACHGSAA